MIGDHTEYQSVEWRGASGKLQVLIKLANIIIDKIMKPPFDLIR